MQRDDVLKHLADYAARYPGEADTVERFTAFVASEPRCFERDCWRGHVTGSAWVVNALSTHVLLTHHKKLNRWLQLGGHSDGDHDPLRVACREAAEESGLSVVPVSDVLFDIDIHPIPARRGDPEHLHYDARFALQVVDSERYRLSDESHELRWVGIDNLATVTTEPSMLRMALKWLGG